MYYDFGPLKQKTEVSLQQCNSDWPQTQQARQVDLGVAVLLLSSGILPAGWTGGESRLLGLMMLFAFIEVCSLPADADLLGLCLTGSAVLALSASKLSPNKLADN